MQIADRSAPVKVANSAENSVLQAYRWVAWQEISHISVLLLGTDSIENSFLSIVACIRVYKAVAWQRVDQFRYGILIKSCIKW
jgi:hypothetical protein